MERVLEIRDLTVNLHTSKGPVQVVGGFNLNLNKGEALAVVGESGCGKTVTAHAIMRLIPESVGKIAGGSIIYKNRDLIKAGESEIRDLRGREITMIFQDSLTSLNPTMKIGRQIAEAISRNGGLSPDVVSKRVTELLELVGIPASKQRADQYPYELSGGMRQRIMIAMAIAGNPGLIIADEPTTALDPTIQAQILELLKGLLQTLGTSILLITHDFGIVAGFCSRVAVMYAGEIVESGASENIFYTPFHPYTKGLLRCVPRLDSVDELREIAGQPPIPGELLSGCSFWPRCENALKICSVEKPPQTVIKDGHTVSCWLTGGSQHKATYRGKIYE